MALPVAGRDPSEHIGERYFIERIADRDREDVLKLPGGPLLGLAAVFEASGIQQRLDCVFKIAGRHVDRFRHGVTGRFLAG